MINRNHQDCTLDATESRYTLEFLLLEDLRQLLDEPQTSQTRHSLLFILDHLLLNLPRQFVLARKNGCATEFFEGNPIWHQQIEELPIAHAVGISALDELRTYIVDELPFDDFAAEISRDLHRWMQSLCGSMTGEPPHPKAISLDLRRAS